MSDSKGRAFSVSDMIKCGLFAALIIVGAQIKFQIGTIPFTMQFAFANLAGLLLGRKLGATSVIVYVLLGLIGLPVFAGGGGIAYLFKPSFGYLIGFIIGAFVAGDLSERLKFKAFANNLIASLANLVIVYTIGVVYLYFSMKMIAPDKAMSFATALQVGVIIFIPSDLTWSVLGSLVATRVKPIINRGI